MAFRLRLFGDAILNLPLMVGNDFVVDGSVESLSLLLRTRDNEFDRVCLLDLYRFVGIDDLRVLPVLTVLPVLPAVW